MFIYNNQLGAPPYEEQLRNHLAWEQSRVSLGYFNVYTIADSTGKPIEQIYEMANTWVSLGYAEWKNGIQTNFAMTMFARQASFLAALKLANNP
jgi:hypothetical protein